MAYENKPCYPLSRTQLRQMVRFDNLCAHEYFNIPLRHCEKFYELDELQKSSGDDNDVSNPAHGVSNAEFDLMRMTIRTMWSKMSTIWEAFQVAEQPELGIRMRVKNNLAIKLTLKASEQVLAGWSSTCPQSGSCAHVYLRSPMEVGGYLGGPVSYCNWSSKRADLNIKVNRSIHGPDTFKVYATCSNVPPGTELLWNYGSRKQIDFKDWFLSECCKTAQPIQRPFGTDKLYLDCNLRDLHCVLCGEAFKRSKKVGRIQMKPHFVDSHADYLGTEWQDLSDDRTQLEVDGLKVLTAAEVLNTLLQKLSKKLNWNYIPACTVLTKEELDDQSPEGRLKSMQLFFFRCNLLRRGGVIVLCGTQSATEYEQLHPISKTTWKKLQWKPKTQPKRGTYSLPKSHLNELLVEVRNSVRQCLIQILKTDSVNTYNDAESSDGDS